jgi:D-alanyl-lipoteichoic acid acyltransferase DltB (MBOAT superfamily)
LAVLFFFKYYNFFVDVLHTVLPETKNNFVLLNVLLPVGISFYTFQALAYTIDVYRGTVKAERNIITYALFVTFFPQLVAGPIERSARLLPQFKIDHTFNYDRITSGLKLAAWGMFKKVAIANRLALYVNAVYGNPDVYPAASVILATLFFAIQIYCDFSGYSDIAIGSARILGFKIMSNFNKPYFSASFREFWMRWHISLSTWLKDYVYIPLGGNRKGKFRQNANLFITFLISGLWHGAAWHFVVWGALHGFFQIIERMIFKAKDAKTNYIRIAIMFILICLTWVFFRASSISDAFFIFKKMAALPADMRGYIDNFASTGAVATLRDAFQLGNLQQNVAYAIKGFGLKRFLYALIAISFLVFTDIWTRNGEGGTKKIKRLPLAVRWAGYYAVLISILGSMEVESTSQFIYFAF